MIKVCKNCTERQPGCHDKCAKYLKDKLKNDYVRIRKQKEMEQYTVHESYRKEVVGGYTRYAKIKSKKPKGMR